MTRLSALRPSTFLLVLFLLSYGLTVKAEEQLSSRLKELAKSEQWYHLLHYHQVGLVSKWQSQADDQAFFFAANGAKDPFSELEASYAALLNDENDARCRFPARLHWINQNVPASIPLGTCPDYEKWRDEINAEGLTLIFPAAYLNSPSSMFGHTLLRVDSATHKNPLLDYSVNYAANADPNDNELVFSYKGLTGGYPGVFSVLPYYEKVKEYSYLEARDVWEYKLDIDAEELAQFIRHTWEIKDTHFDYYFFTENCSYHLLTLLDAASERFDLADEFYTDVIPADTVRVLSQAGLIKEASFRPSSLTRMTSMQSQMPQAHVVLAKRLVEEDAEIDLSTLTPKEQAQVLELAFQYTRYLVLKRKVDSKALSRKSLSILSKRSKIALKKVFTPVETPQTRDDQGHRSHRHQFSFGREYGQNFWEYGLRMSYHDFLDTLAGYVPGARLEIIHARLRYLQQDKRARLQELKFIDIASLSPRDNFFKPLSWFVQTGFKRMAPTEDKLSAYLTAGPGLSFKANNQLLSAMLSTEINVDGDINKGFRLGSGPRLVWLNQNDHWSTELSWQRLYDLAGADFSHQRTRFGISRSINHDWQVRLEAHYDDYENKFGQSEHDSSAIFSFMRYF